MKINRRITCLLFITIFVLVSLNLGICAQEIVVSGGSIGGTSNLAISAIAAIGSQYCGLSPTVVSTPTMAQVDVLEDREAVIATTPGYLTYNAYNGLGKWLGKPFTEVRSLTNRPNSQMQIAVLKESSIQNVMDLKGKRVVMGKKGFTAAELGAEMFDALGIDAEKDLTPLYLGHGDAIASLVSNKADAYLLTGGYPHSGLIELSEMHDEGIRLIHITEEQMNTILDQKPFFRAKTIEKVYKGMEEEIVTAEYVNVFGCVDLSEEIAYCLTKNYWEHLDFAALQWNAIGKLKLEDTSDIKGVAPWHMGAYRYYKEVGLEIPDEMIPPEAR
jgi:uncharacterized protein